MVNGGGEEIRGRWLQILAAVETARELDADRCASVLAEKTGLRVGMADTFLRTRARAGLLAMGRAELLRSGAAGPVT